MYTEASTFRSLICALLWYSVDPGQKENNFLNLKEFKYILTCSNGSRHKRFSNLSNIEHRWGFDIVPVLLRERIHSEI